MDPWISLTPAEDLNRARTGGPRRHPRCRRSLLLAVGLAGVAGAAVTTGANSQPNVSLHLGSVRAGDAPEHRLTLDVAAGDAEIHRADVGYPPGFSFKGFLAIGDVGAVVGAYGLDFAFDGTPDVAVPLRSLGAGSAFADVFADGRFDPALEPVLHHVGSSTFSLTLPLGGDATGTTLTASQSVRVSLVLFAGLMANPHLGGRHVISGEFTSVDPDTDGPDDGHGDPPTVQRVDLPVEIDGPRLTPFAWLYVSRFNLTVRAGFSRPDHPFPHRDDSFEVRGRLALGPSSDGIDLQREIVTVVLDSFLQSIDGRSFQRIGPFYRYRGAPPGITRMDLSPDGRFDIRADGLHWIAAPHDLASPADCCHGLGPPIRFALRIGNDLGETSVRASRGHRPF